MIRRHYCVAVFRCLFLLCAVFGAQQSAFGESAAVDADVLARFFTKIEILQRNHQILRAQFDTVAQKTETLEKRLQELAVEFDGRLALIESTNADTAFFAEKEANTGATLVAFAEEHPVYQEAISELLQDRFAKAAELFTLYLAENSTTSLADNARLWLAESLLRSGAHAAAIAELDTYLNIYDDDKEPDKRYWQAQYRRGEALFLSGAFSEARAAFLYIATEGAYDFVARATMRIEEIDKKIK